MDFLLFKVVDKDLVIDGVAAVVTETAILHGAVAFGSYLVVITFTIIIYHLLTRIMRCRKK